ncbi:MAG: hypothetical protein LUQ36_08185 [Methanoregula sp.]|nr:hypothetical protein [Methanoregula sp.]
MMAKKVYAIMKASDVIGIDWNQHLFFSRSETIRMVIHNLFPKDAAFFL